MNAPSPSAIIRGLLNPSRGSPQNAGKILQGMRLGLGWASPQLMLEFCRSYHDGYVGMARYWQTLCSRWTQAKRHALGVSEVVYAPLSADPSLRVQSLRLSRCFLEVLSASFLAFLELPSWRLVLGGRKLTRVARGSKGGCEGEKDGKVRRQN